MCRYFKKVKKSNDINFSISVLVLFIAVIIAFTVSVNIVWGSGAVVKFQEDRIDIKAEKVPLMEIMVEIANNTGLTIRTEDPLINPVSLNYKSNSIEKSIKRLLAGYNYAIVYSEIDKRPVPVELNIFGKGSLRLLNSKNETPQQAPKPMDEHMKRYSNQWYAQQVRDPKKLLKEISVGQEGREPGQQGIVVTKLEKKSFFDQIGIREGDRITNVDGYEINSSKKFIERLTTANRETNIIRIERFNNENIIDPIYIELNGKKNPTP